MRATHLGLLLSLVIVVACSGQEEIVTTTTATSDPTTVAESSTSTSSTSSTTQTTLSPTTSTTFSSEPVSPTALVGAWSFEAAQAEVFVVFDDDGSYQTSFIIDSEAPLDFGQYTFDGAELFLSSDEEVTFNGCGGTSARYITAFSEDEQSFTLVANSAEDECTRRLRDLTQAEFTRVSGE